MAYRLHDPGAEVDFPVRWRRGAFFDTDTEHRRKALKIADEVDREEAVEVIEDKAIARRHAKEAKEEEQAASKGASK